MNRLAIAFLTALLVAPIFLGTAAAIGAGPNNQQRTNLQTVDPSLPKGQWETLIDQTTFYLKSNHPRAAPVAATWGNTANGYPQSGGGAYAGGQDGSPDHMFWLDTQYPRTPQFATGTDSANDQTIRVGNAAGQYATFNFLGWDPQAGTQPKLGDWSNLSVLRLEAAIYADYHNNPGERLRAIFWIQNATTGVRQAQPLANLLLEPVPNSGPLVRVGTPVCCPTTAGTQWALYRASVDLNLVDGVRIGRGNVLSMDVGVAGGNQPTTLIHISSSGTQNTGFPSLIRITSDAVRVNAWAEKTDGSVANTFPSGRISQTEDTRIRFKLVVAHHFGNADNCVDPVASEPRPVNTLANWCTMDALDQRSFQLRLRNLETGALMPVDLGGGLQGGDPNQDELIAQCCNNEHRKIDYIPVNARVSDPDPGRRGIGVFSYTFPYNATFTDGPYNVEYRAGTNLTTDWMGDFRVHIGGVGFELEPAPEEASFLTYLTNPDTGAIVTPLQLVEVNHTIFVGERTDYHVVLRNTGTTTDTFGLSVPVPEHGWAVTVHPSTVTLPAGGEQLIKVQVVPPASGPFSLAGAWKAVNLQAVSLRSDDTETLRLNTTLTSEVKWGVRLFTEETFVEAQPLLPKVLPAGLINLGTKEDTFVVTATGDLPPSWSVEIQPPHVSAYPKSMQDFRVVVTAPTEAQGGEQYSLVLRATRIADSAVFSEKIIVVSVVIRDGFVVEPFDTTARIWRDAGDSIVVCGDVDQQSGGQPGAENPQCAVYGTSGASDPLYRLDDLHFDHSALYRFRLENTGDREDRFRIQGTWTAPQLNAVPAGDVDAAGCDDNTNGENTAPDLFDGVPDGWRFRIVPRPDLDVGNITTIPTVPQLAQPVGNQPADPDAGAARNTNLQVAFSGDMNIGEVVLGAGEEMEFYVEMQWQDPDDGVYFNRTGCTTEEEYSVTCWNCVFAFEGESTTTRWAEPSPAAGLRMTVRSTNDPTLEVVHRLTADVATGRDVQLNTAGQQTGRHPNGFHDVFLERQLGQPQRERIPLPPPGTTLPINGTYDLRVTNTGNEVDDIRLRIAEEAPGWTHRFNPVVDIVRSTNTDWAGTIGPAANGAQNPRCELRGTHEMLCRDIGVYDEVRFQVNATPPRNVDPNSLLALDYVKITATAGIQSPLATTHDLRVDGIVGGDFRFEETELDAVKEVYPGQVVAFPFSVENIGLEDDIYQILVESGDVAWKPKLSSAPHVSVPAGRSHHGFLSVSVPDAAPFSNDPILDPELKPFVVRVRSVNNPTSQVERLEFWADVRNPEDSGGLLATSAPTTVVAGTVARVNVTVRDPEESVPNTVPVTMRINRTALPQGWELVCTGAPGLMVPTACNGGFNNPYMDIRLFAGADATRQAVGQFFLRVPEGELATSRMVLRVLLNTSSVVQYHDVEINLQSVYGVGIDTYPLPAELGGNVAYVAPGDAVVHHLEVRNLGLTPQTVRLEHSALPPGWNVTFSRQSVFLQPGERTDSPGNPPVEVIVQAPVRGQTGAEAAFIVFAKVVEDTGRTSSVNLVTKIGSYDLLLTGPSETTFLGPQEKAIYRLAVQNRGTVPDTVALSLTVPVAYRGFTTVAWQPGICTTLEFQNSTCIIDPLLPNMNRTAIVEVQMTGDPLPPGTIVPFTATAKSALAPVEVGAVSTFTLRQEYLDYRDLDVDGDGFDEYGIDRNRDESDGLEEFREALFPQGTEPAGIQTRVPDLAQFLTDNARQKRTVEIPLENGSRVEVVDVRTDGDDDGRMDFLLDINSDSLPDLYFDPDLRYATRLEVTRDVASDLLQEPDGRSDPRLRPDGVPEYFIDLDGDGRLDAYFEITSATFGKLIQQFVDRDDFVDYVVDIDGDGRKDNGEPILFGGPAGVVRSLVMVDMDGDGNLDEVYDTQGDGHPDYFIPAGSQRQYPIRLDDIDDDGTVEWLFDADGDGRVDSYYDPDTGESRSIDTRSGFVRDLAKFWYVGAIFALVLVLFVVLVAVTRR